MVYADGGTCIFGDVGEVLGATAYCRTHDDHCRVKPTFLVLGGWSCKDLSAMKGQSTQGALRSGVGESSHTFHLLCKYLESHPSAFYLGENVDDLVKATANTEYVYKAATIQSHLPVCQHA